jgi:threonine/homoserine/homoserine lactone efflux protein
MWMTSMPEPAVLASFIIAVLLMQLPLGPNNMLIIARAIGENRRAALVTVLGMTFGAGIVQVPLLAIGVATIVRQAPVAFDIFRFVGAAYLLWLGWRVLTSPRRIERVPTAKERTAPKAFAEGMGCALIDPTSTGFMLAFLPQFVNPAAGPVAVQLLIFGIIQKLSGAIVLGSYALISGAAGDWLRHNPRAARWQARFAGSTMIVLGLRMAFAGPPR